MTESIERNALYVGLAAAWTAMLGSLYFSEVAGYLPCVLCWYQRILMYPLALIIAVGLLRRDRNAPYYVLPFSLLGIGMSTYHYLLQKTELFDSGAVCQAGIPCTSMWINWLGFITIPFLALTAFMIITVTAFIALQASAGETESEPEGESGRAVAEPTPWLPVGGTILAVFAFVALLGLLNRPDVDAAAAPALTVVEAPAGAAMSVAQDATQAEVIEEVIDGAALYQAACAACHGAEMQGVPNLGNALVDNPFIADQDDAELLAFMRAGRMLNDPANVSGLVMPPSGGQPGLTDPEMLAIIQHMRTGQASE